MEGDFQSGRPRILAGHGISALIGLTVLLCAAVVMLHYWDLHQVPPGFWSDETGVAYDAQSIATDGRDSGGVYATAGRDPGGAFMPIFIDDFGAGRCPLFVYTVAVIFKLLGPGVVQARAVATSLSLATAVLLALLVWRLFSNRWLAVGTFLVASVTPWLFKQGRLAFEPVMLPAALALFLLIWQEADRSGRWYLGAAAGVSLGLSAYTYIAAWLFAPLLCLALVIAELPGFRWRLLLSTGAGAALVALPLLLYMRGHPAVLTQRYREVAVWLPGDSIVENLGRVWRVYTSGFSPGYLFGQALWIQGGEFFSVLAPALVAGLVSIWQVRSQRFWRLVVLGLVLAPIPGALTVDFSNELRNLEAVPFYLTLMALGVWRLAPLFAKERLVVASLIGLLSLQAGWFLSDYFTRMPQRISAWQTAGMEQAMDDSVRLANHRPIFLMPDLYSIESPGPGAVVVAFAFFEHEDPREYRRSGISALNAYVYQPGTAIPEGAVVVTLPTTAIPGARLIESVNVSYPDDWGAETATPAYLIWRVP